MSHLQYILTILRFMHIDDISRVTGSCEHNTRKAVSELREAYEIYGEKMDLYNTQTEALLRLLMEEAIEEGLDICPFVDTNNKDFNKTVRKIKNHFEVDRKGNEWKGLVPKAPIYVERETLDDPALHTCSICSLYSVL